MVFKCFYDQISTNGDINYYYYSYLLFVTGCGIFSAAAPTCIALYGAYFSKPSLPSPAVTFI